VNALGSHRRHPAAIVVLLLLGLLATGGLYSLLAPGPAEAAVRAAGNVEEGKNLFLANCATCHSAAKVGNVEIPQLVGVGAAAVDFQVGTGRMPPAQVGSVQVPKAKPKFTQGQIDSLAAYVAADFGKGPAIPPASLTNGAGNLANGNELFRVNCAMCHNFAGSGGALTRGKYAPSLRNSSGKHMYEAMLTGPESMPVFNDKNLSPTDKKDIISYLKNIDENRNPGGLSLGNLGPVSEGMFVWVFGLGLMIGAAVWLGSKAA
jgi:ubiquinol-cytochrome c reductase cytochrome c subunit